jgi:hypothetical protein
MGFVLPRPRTFVCAATLLLGLLLVAAASPPQAPASGLQALSERQVFAVLPAAVTPGTATAAASGISGAAGTSATAGGALAPVTQWVTRARAITPGTGFPIFSDGFESGLFSWHADGSPTWGRTAARAASGTYSVYCAGSSLLPPGPYLNEMDSWLVSGPYDLSTITSAYFSFKVWMQSEPADDVVQALVSVDGVDFFGWAGSGNSQGWIDRGYDLTYVPGIGNLCGRDKVWLAFVFRSDASVTGEGAYVDDVSLLGARQLSISSFSPATAATYERVILEGTGFTGVTSVRFNGTQAGIESAGDRHISTSVPAGATTGPITVTTPQGTTTSLQSFTVIPPPAITDWSPKWGPVGSSVTVTGSGFTGTTNVAFRGIAAAFDVVDDERLTVTVPIGATTSCIEVTTPGGRQSARRDFVVSATTPPPQMVNFDPAWGPIGSTVKLSGFCLSGATSVKFRGRPAKFLVQSDELITAVVPPLAMSGAITITTPFGTGSASTFNVMKPRPKIGRPISPRTTRAGVTFKVYGTLRPHVRAGSRTVKVRVYRYTGEYWAKIRTLSAVNSDASGASRYTAKLSLKRGRYRFQAYALETPTTGANGSVDSRVMTVK